MTADMPWSDCKVAFDCDDEDKLWAAHSAGRLTLPPGWSLDGTDGSGARSVVLFRVEGIAWPEDGNAVRALLRRLGAVAKAAAGAPACPAPQPRSHVEGTNLPPVNPRPAPPPVPGATATCPLCHAVGGGHFSSCSQYKPRATMGCEACESLGCTGACGVKASRGGERQ